MSDNIKNKGWCHCCRKDTEFHSEELWLRDHYFCSNCRSIPRQRHLQHILDSDFSGWESLCIHESSPSNQFISELAKDYSSSQYIEDAVQGDFVNGVRCENLEQLTFESESFDIFITQDVFEHIFNPQVAAKEIMRVLKPGGIHIFTAPKHKGIEKSYARAKIENGKIVHLLEEQYHGNPVGDGRALVTWDYGHDFELLLAKWSSSHITTYITRDRAIGIDGEFLEVFVMHKAM